jgi:peptidoglycan/LPS O-acetylase OafA/YrhL
LAKCPAFQTYNVPDSSRIPLIDTIKAVAAQLIVLHHLAWFGPMSDVAAGGSAVLAGWQSWLAEYGRYAVAAFFAVGGYLAAQALPLQGLPRNRSPWQLIGQRYLRLVGPYAVALLLAMVCAALARQWLTHDSIGTTPGIWQFFAHLLLLHDLLDFEALSAGVWYIAIDFQLYALLVGLLWIAGRRPAIAVPGDTASHNYFQPLLVLCIALVSLFFFNQREQWDATALYFFGAYALGVGSGWAVRSADPYRYLLLLALVGVAALWFDFRPRIAVALLVSLALGLAHLNRLQLWNGGARLLASLGNMSYALFLVHFPVCLLINAFVHRLAPHDPLLNALGLLLAWAASNLAALWFYRHVELRLSALWRKRAAASL